MRRSYRSGERDTTGCHVSSSDPLEKVGFVTCFEYDVGLADQGEIQPQCVQERRARILPMTGVGASSNRRSIIAVRLHACYASNFVYRHWVARS